MKTTSLAERLTSRINPMVDVDTVARAVFDAVGEAVPSAFACLATTDPASGLITGAYKSSPLPMGDEEFSAAEYGGPDINQFAELARRPEPVGVLSIDTGGDPDRSRRFREFMRPRFGFTDELRLACRTQGTTWGALALYRGASEPPFTEHDAALVAGVHEIIAAALRRVLFAPSRGGASSTMSSAVLIVDAVDRVTDLTAAAHERIGELGGWDQSSLPSNVLAVVALAPSGTSLA